jgi:subtilase family serine protease
MNLEIMNLDRTNNKLIKTITILLIDKSFILKDTIISPFILNKAFMENENPSISAEVVLKSKSGRSLVDEDVPITSDNIEEFSPTEDTIKEAIHRLQQLGFTVPQTGVTLTIVGNQTQFEKVFGIKLALSNDKQKYGISIHSDREPVIPDSLKDIVEKLVFISPPKLLS